MNTHKISRKALILAVLGLTALVFSAGRSSAFSAVPVVNTTQNSKLDFSIVNKSGEAIFQVYIGPKGLQDWTDDIEVLRGQMLQNGASTQITFSPKETATVWDIRVVYDNDARGVFVRGVDLTRLKTLTITQDANFKTTFRYGRENAVVNSAKSKPISDSMVPTEISDIGYADKPRFLADVNNDGIKDFCRATGSTGQAPDMYLACQLGRQGGFSSNQYGFNSAKGTDFGYAGTAWMEDINGDGRMDFCRKVGTAPDTFYAAMLAGPNGFSREQYTRIRAVTGGAWVME
jgi:hypothetical protein